VTHCILAAPPDHLSLLCDSSGKPLRTYEVWVSRSDPEFERLMNGEKVRVVPLYPAETLRPHTVWLLSKSPAASLHAAGATAAPPAGKAPADAAPSADPPAPGTPPAGD
jgi:hypothetical protein